MPAAGHLADMDWWRRNDLPLECYWMDAGWTDMSKGWAAHQSNRVPSRELFPEGMRPLADAAHERDLAFLLWFVPESVHPEVEIGKQHPEWLSAPFADAAYGDNVFYGLDHGDPRVNRFMIDCFSEIISSYGIDVFRQDGLHLWPAETDPDRLGINQIRYNEGFYAFWDGLLARHPHLLIDNCGCGGRKLDLETVRRGIVLWRSDCQASGDFDPISSQAFTYGLSFWLPLHGAAVPLARRFGGYAFRSGYAPAMLMTWPGKPADHRHGMDLDLLRRLMREYLAVRPCFFGDFYPLTDYSLDQETWMAWQFDRAGFGEGVVQAFRRADTQDASIRCRLRGLVSEAAYEVTDLDTGRALRVSGAELLDTGVELIARQRPGAAILRYRRAESPS